MKIYFIMKLPAKEAINNCPFGFTPKVGSSNCVNCKHCYGIKFNGSMVGLPYYDRTIRFSCSYIKCKFSYPEAYQWRYKLLCLIWKYKCKIRRYLNRHGFRFVQSI